MADLNIYGPIGGISEGSISANTFSEMMAGVEKDEDLDIHINSPGGSIFEGLTIYDSLVNHAGHVNIVIQGVAASIASIIAMAGDKITMAQSGRFMIHNPMGPSVMAFGTADKLRDAASETTKIADTLDSIRDSLAGVYAARSGQSQKKILDWMDEQTYFNAADAVKFGFADKVRANKSLAAAANLLAIEPIAPVSMEGLLELEDLARNLKIRNSQVPKPGSAGKLRLAKCKLDAMERSL